MFNIQQHTLQPNGQDKGLRGSTCILYIVFIGGTVSTRTSHEVLCIRKPLLGPTRPEVFRIESRRPATLDSILLHHLDVNLSTILLLRPHGQTDDVITSVVQYSGRDWELDLVTDPRVESAVLISIHKQLDTNLLRGRGVEDKSKGSIHIGRDIERDYRAVEVDVRAVKAGAWGAGVPL